MLGDLIWRTFPVMYGMTQERFCYCVVESSLAANLLAGLIGHHEPVEAIEHWQRQVTTIIGYDENNGAPLFGGFTEWEKIQERAGGNAA
jgi:hypothetical protein